MTFKSRNYPQKVKVKRSVPQLNTNPLEIFHTDIDEEEFFIVQKNELHVFEAKISSRQGKPNLI